MTCHSLASRSATLKTGFVWAWPDVEKWAKPTGREVVKGDVRRARLDVIHDIVGSDETIVVEVLALLFDPGGGLKKREAEGWLVLTDRRLVFGTARHGVLIELPTTQIAVPVTVTYKFTMARLVVKADSGAEHTFVVNRSAARELALAINESAAD